MDALKRSKEYCIGCGLCQSELKLEMKPHENGYLYPDFDKVSKEDKFFEQVCPINASCDEKKKVEIWGQMVEAYAGYAVDKDIRKRASSGGMLTALAIYLLESGKVDGIIHVMADSSDPTKTVCRVSSTREEVENCCGSRYAISSPWMHLSESVVQEKKYAAIGKPCDIAALRRLKDNLNRYENIIYLLSFFCAGLPSQHANDRLLSELGCDKNACAALTYRGNGWPGYATATDDRGNVYQMEYSKAWGGILGRDIHPYCRLCVDGIGEYADIACGDGWYITEEQTPDFTERDGRNIAFARNTTGELLLKDAEKAGAIVLEKWKDISELEIIQKYQYTRKTTMRAKLFAYRMMGKLTPKYDRQMLREYSKYAKKQQKFKIFAGTIKRILKGTI